MPIIPITILAHYHKNCNNSIVYTVKLIVFKKGIIIAVCLIVAAGALIGICCGVTAANASASAEKVIVIDAGHGGIDAGVHGVESGAKESDINLAIAKKLKGYFSGAGFKVVMTRSDNGGLYGLATKGFKMRDMKKRKQIIEDCKADMVISVHQNSCPVPSRRGGTVFFDKGSECGKALADLIQASLNGMEECVKQSTALVGDYYMLKCTPNPSVIVECGFMTNPEDDRLLNTDEYRDKLAYAIFKGAVSYYS